MFLIFFSKRVFSVWRFQIGLCTALFPYLLNLLTYPSVIIFYVNIATSNAKLDSSIHLNRDEIYYQYSNLVEYIYDLQLFDTTGTLTRLPHAFSQSIKEYLKKTTQWSAHYFTRRERWYPFADNTLSLGKVT